MNHVQPGDGIPHVRDGGGESPTPHRAVGDDASPSDRADRSADLMDGVESMLSVLIHNGRNYLGPIKGYASLIQDDTDDTSNTRRWADKILRNVREMEDHFNSLDLYRMKRAEGITEISWHRLISDVMDRFAAINVRGVPIEIVNETRGTFRQHKELLKRVLVHLIANAYESIGQTGKLDLTIVHGADADDGRRRFKIRVNDTGCGIDGTEMQRIWIPFYTTKDNHIGLGLPFVAAAAALMEMDLEVVSTTGRGTGVNLVLTEQGG